jgi:hypothetical protein
MNSGKFRTLCALDGSIVGQYAFNSHRCVIVPSKSQRERRVKRAGSTVLTTVIREDMAATYPKVVGRIIFSRQEFHSWLRENLPVLNGMGMRLNKVVYTDMSKLESEPYGLKEDILYRDHKDNPLINDFGMYVLSRLYTFQNLREAFLVKADTDIVVYVRSSTELLDGNRVT